MKPQYSILGFNQVTLDLFAIKKVLFVYLILSLTHNYTFFKKIEFFTPNNNFICLRDRPLNRQKIQVEHL